jgi:hypothetical protein
MAPTIASFALRVLFRGRGLAGSDLERAVDVITADRRWVDTMLPEEYGLPKAMRSRPKR